MPKHTYNDETDFPVLPDGDYLLTLTDFYDVKTSENDNEYIKFKLETEKGSNIFYNLTFSPKNGWRVDAFLKAFGVAPAKGTTFEFDTTFCNTLIGKRAWATLYTDEYQGRKNNKVSAFIIGKAVPAADDVPF